MRNGETVARFEKAFASYVGAEFGIAMCNGTATLHAALVALGVESWPEGDAMGGDKVAVPPLTMASTTIAVLHAGGVPLFMDVDPDTWVWRAAQSMAGIRYAVPVSLYGLHVEPDNVSDGVGYVVDAAQTLQPHGPHAVGFTSYSFQASKHLSIGEGGMLCTNSEELATRAREFSSLGYRMDAKSPRIDPAVLKHPTYARHHSLGWNYRLSDTAAELGLFQVMPYFPDSKECLADKLVSDRRAAASYYREAIEGCDWIQPQHIPEGSSHDMWTFAVALESRELFDPFVEAIVRHGGERPFGCWKITYQEPAFRHLAEDGTCPVAEDLQPRLLQFQTNRLDSARTNADAVAAAIREVGG